MEEGESEADPIDHRIQWGSACSSGNRQDEVRSGWMTFWIKERGSLNEFAERR